MEEYVTIASFKMPYQVHIIMGRLESEGIPCQLKDEYTAYNQYLSNAVSGVKLMVRLADYERAKAILIENGYTFNAPETLPGWYVFLNDKTSALSFLKDFSLEKRMVILSLFLIAVLAIIFYFVSE